MFVKLHHVTHLWVFEFIMCDHYGLLFGVTQSGDAIECNWPIISRAAWFRSPLNFVLPSHCSFVWAVRLTPETYRHIIAKYMFYFICIWIGIILLYHSKPRLKETKQIWQRAQAQAWGKKKNSSCWGGWGVGWCNWDRMRWYQHWGRHE